MTYPDPIVNDAIASRFIPVKLDLSRDRSVVRELNVYWTPTILFGDRRGRIHYESLDFLPPAEFLDILDIGEAMVALRWAGYQRAHDLLASIEERNRESPFVAEALYRQGLVAFLESGSSARLRENASMLADRYPDSAWTKRPSYPVG